MKTRRRLFGALLILALMALVVRMPADLPGTAEQLGQRSLVGINLLTGAQTSSDTDFWVSDPVTPELTLAARDLPPAELLPTLDREINPRMNFGAQPEPREDPPSRPDPLLALAQVAPTSLDTGFATPIFNFNGQGFSGSNPPDTVGAIGKDHFIQMINATRVAIYDKTTGALVIPPFSLTTLGGCATGNGDPIVLYDQLADRWFLSEFGSGNSLCVYISQTADPTGAYYSYQFTTPSFPDYPKYGVWPDAYYATTNESSPAIYAFNRAAMLAGTAATSQRFTAPGLAGFGFEALTPADLDGMTPPPAGAPNYLMRHVDTEAHNVAGYPTNDILEIWAFSVNWTTPGNSTFTKIADILVAEFDSTLCGLTSFFCMGMPGVAQGASSSLDPLREVIMNRLAYRNFGTHQVLVGNFVTDIGSNIGGVRWFELRKIGAGAWTLHQEGTYAPTTSDNRWMGGIAMDSAGNIALAYNVSSQTIYPSLRYAGRLVTDPLGTLPQGEYTLSTGSANNGSNRYGDYAAMTIDPIDGCTFWFTGQWNDASQWKTRIGAFRFDACGEIDFTLAVTPADQQVCLLADASYDVALAPISDFTGNVTLSVEDAPGIANFASNPVAVPGNSTLTISDAALGAYTFDVYGVSVLTPTLVHSQTVLLQVVGAAPGAPVLLTPANAAANVPLLTTFTWEALPEAAAYGIELATDYNFANVVISATHLLTSTWTPGVALDPDTVYYWRVWADNACGVSGYSATRILATAPAAGCGAGAVANPVYTYGFETADGNWTGSGTGNTWTRLTTNPYVGAYHARGAGSSSVSDQRFTSPIIELPADENPVLLEFWHLPNLETRTGGCYDGGILEISANGGTSWTQISNTLLLEGSYTGLVSTSFSNPLGGLQAWCGPTTQPYMQTIADLTSYAGQSVQLRMRLGTDSSTGRTGWDVDNVLVQSCQPVSVNPSMTLTKTVGTDPAVCATTDSITVTQGADVTYCYTVNNNGDVPLQVHTLQDSALGNLLTEHIYPLAPGATLSLTQTATINANTVSTATWMAISVGVGDPITATASTAVNIKVTYQLFLPLVLRD